MSRYDHGVDAISPRSTMPTARREQIHGRIQPMDEDNDDISLFWPAMVICVVAAAVLYFIGA